MNKAKQNSIIFIFCTQLPCNWCVTFVSCIKAETD